MGFKTNLYKDFIKKNFPHSGVLESNELNRIYDKVCENNIITEAFKCNIEKLKQPNSEVFLSRYTYFFNKILLQIPTNDIESISYYIRSITESLLKFVLSLNTDKAFEDINKMSFKNIKKNLKDEKSNIEYVAELDLLFSIYGKYSNLIHKKNSYNTQELEYIEDIITGQSINIEKIDMELLKIIDSYEKIVSKHFKFKVKDIDSKNCLSLKRFTTGSRHKRILDNLYKEI